MSKKVFNKYSDYYDLLYKDKNYYEEANFIHNLIKIYRPQSKYILEFGSGTGKHANILAKLGYKIHGIELSQEMVSKAHIVQGFTIQQGNIAKIKINKTFDIVLSLFHVMSYQITNRQFKDVFFNAATHLKNNGIFIFDFWYSPAVHSQKPSIRVKNVSNKELEVTRIAQPTIKSNKNIVEVNYKIFVRNLINKKIDMFKEKHIIRHFYLSEIDFMCDLYGFKRLEAKEFITGKKINSNTWAPYVILKKIDKSKKK